MHSGTLAEGICCIFALRRTIFDKTLSCFLKVPIEQIALNHALTYSQTRDSPILAFLHKSNIEATSQQLLDLTAT
ncbi:hypothetical protein [Adlercreutzia sp. ZJ304]|uniref:hypothetical protein n=1 Tax=Adlercreutzia sp. ZJ304 TaxID=2709791 RepID=UPI0013EB70B3|nr:hypothetical protein [Adlercreutzia sp. ZJ304]